jgi:benzodiazapine receptor
MTMAKMLAQGREPWLSAVVLGCFIAGCLAVGAVASWVTQASVATWYPTLAKPWFNPPNWLFGPAWTFLYVTMAIAAWLVWRSDDRVRAQDALYLFGFQLALNLAWSLLFFGLRDPGLALVEVVVFWLAIAATTRAFWPLDRRAGLLMLPYLAWVGFATLLNAAIWWMN